MSGRRRRRRGGSARSRTGEDTPRRAESNEASSQSAQQPAQRRGRRRRGRSVGPDRAAASPRSSEDLVRAIPKPRPEQLTGPPDGQTLEGIIGELQSHWGVPQYPQEYRITLKVAEEREPREREPRERDSRGPESRQAGRGSVVAVAVERSDPADPLAAPNEGGMAAVPRRERAPSLGGGMDVPAGERSGRSRRGRRRRRRGGGPRDGATREVGSEPAASGAGDEPKREIAPPAPRATGAESPQSPSNPVGPSGATSGPENDEGG